MRMQIDKPRRDDHPRHIAHIGINPGCQIQTDFSNDTIQKPNILNLIKPLRRIDHMALPQQNFVRNIRKRHKPFLSSDNPAPPSERLLAFGGRGAGRDDNSIIKGR